MAASPDPFFLIGEVLDAKYRVDRFVAEGGFGVVYAGHQLRLDVPIAIKVLKTNRTLNAEARGEVVERFLAEARTTARLTHPNITRAMDTGVVHTTAFPDGLPWLALEWLDGRTLEDELDARRGQGGRTPRETFELLGPVIDAMAYAHARGVVHRDLKPSNVMLVRERGRLVARILDFGIAKLAEPSVSRPSGSTTTESSVVAFSPGYAAPEQVSRARTGPWTDVHALGLLLTEMLTDELPYGSEEGIQVLSSILSIERPTPQKRGYLVGPWETEIRRAVALNPRDRHNDAGELLDALTNSLDAAEASSRSSPRPPPRSQPVSAASSSSNGERARVPNAARTDVVVAPSRSTTVPNTSALFPSTKPPNPPKPPGKAPIVVGLGITAVLIGGAIFALGPFGSAGSISPVPSSEATTSVVRTHASADAGVRKAQPHVAPTNAPSASAVPTPSVLPSEPSAGNPVVPRPHRVETSTKPGHSPAEPSGSKERLAPTDSFE